jgi:hypothetical protein
MMLAEMQTPGPLAAGRYPKLFHKRYSSRERQSRWQQLNGSQFILNRDVSQGESLPDGSSGAAPTCCIVTTMPPTRQGTIACYHLSLNRNYQCTITLHLLNQLLDPRSLSGDKSNHLAWLCSHARVNPAVISFSGFGNSVSSNRGNAGGGISSSSCCFSSIVLMPQFI